MRRRSPFGRTVVSIAAGTGLLVPAAALSTSATATGSLAASGQATAAVAPSVLLPDLVADAPTNPLLESYSDGSGARLLLRFHGFVHNAGTGPVELRASEPVGTLMTSVKQRLYDDAGGHVDVSSDPEPTVHYEPTDSHDHWHLRSAARYSLWDERRTQEVAPAMKVGFCLLDSQRMDAWAPTTPAYTYSGIAFCQRRLPTATLVTMGVSPGWRDVYGRSLAYQWVDVSDVAPGSYWLSSEVDPEGVVVESQETNARTFAAAASTVPGYRARSFARRVDPVLLLPVSISLPADRYGDAGTLEFRIEEAPRVGRLDQPVGTWFRASSVSYSAPMDYQGQDSFRFSARSAESPFPRTPVVATASLGVRTDPVEQARSHGNRPEHANDASEKPRRAPSPKGPKPKVEDGVVAIPQVQVEGFDILLRTVAAHAGIVRLRAAAGGATLGDCQVRAPAGQVVTCLVETDAWVSPDSVTGVASLHTATGELVGSAVAVSGSTEGAETHTH